MDRIFIGTSKQSQQAELNPDNPWCKPTPLAGDPIPKRKRPTLKDAPPLTFPKLPRKSYCSFA